MLLFLVQFMHLLVVIFMITIPFQNQINLLLIHLSAGMSIFIHWFANNNTCFLSLVEAKLRGINIDHGFIHSIVAPIYDINKEQTNNIVNILLFSLMSISLYKVLTSDRLKEAFELYKKTKQLSSFIILFRPN